MENNPCVLQLSDINRPLESNGVISHCAILTLLNTGITHGEVVASAVFLYTEPIGKAGGTFNGVSCSSDTNRTDPPCDVKGLYTSNYQDIIKSL